MSISEAIQIVESEMSPHKVIGLGETDEQFILGLDNDNEGYETVDKKTGERGFMWVWDFIDLFDEGKAKILNIDTIQ